MTVHPGLRSLISRSATYRILVYSQLTPEWSDRLQGMTVSTVEDKRYGTVTELYGLLPDQAALMGVLNQLYLHLVPLLSVACIKDGFGNEQCL